MKRSLKFIASALCISLIGMSGVAQENQRRNIGFEFGYNGLVFDQATSLTWSNLEANYQYNSKSYLAGRYSNQDVTHLSSIVSPFINTSVSLTKLWPTESLKGYWMAKIGVNMVSQQTSVELECYTINNNTSQQEKTSVQYEESNPMLNLSAERKYLLLPTTGRWNLFFTAGFDAGLGFGSKVKVTGQTEDYSYQGTETSETLTRKINEEGRGTNGYYFGGHIGVGPEVRIGNVKLYGSFNMLLAKLRKVNTATYDVLNTGLTLGVMF